MRKNSKIATVELKSLKQGDVFDSEAGKHIVLGHCTNGETKVIRLDFFEEDIVFDYRTCDYTKSDLKKMFDTEISEAYKNAFREALVEHEVHLQSVDMQDYGTFRCLVRPITFEEAREFDDLIEKPDLPDWWWTCTPWSTPERGWKYSLAVVSPRGSIYGDGCRYGSGVRPVCILKSNLFVSVEE